MITATEMLDEIAVLNRAGYTPARDGQSVTWHEVLRRWCYRHHADVDRATVHEAILDLCADRGSEHGGSFVNVGDLIAGIQRIRRERLAAAESGGQLQPTVDLEPSDWHAWGLVAHEAVAQGASRLAAEAVAYQRIGVEIPEELAAPQRLTLEAHRPDDPRILAMASRIGASVR